jgi:hypothetical protein
LISRRLLFLATAAAVAFGACSTQSSGPSLTDPREILTKSVLTIKDMKTVHLRADASGQVKLDLSNSGKPTSLDLKDTMAELDLDIPAKKAHLSFSSAVLPGLSADVIVLGQDTYTKISLLGPKYTKSTSTSAGPAASAAVAAADPQKIVDGLNQFLATPSVAPTKQADEKCGDKDCYHVSLNLTSDQINGAVGGTLGTSAPTGSGTVDVWVQKDDLRPAKLTVAASGGDQSNVIITITFTKYDAPVTINPPPETEVNPAASAVA